jgi:hypothetical protein
LLAVVVHPITKRARQVFDKLRWDKAAQWKGTTLEPRPSVSFFPATEGEIVALLREEIQGIEITHIVKMPHFLF